MDINTVNWPGWETVRLIGRGSFGAVYEIRRDVLGDIETAALKVISIPKDSNDIEELYNDGYDDESITIKYEEHLKSIISEYTMMRKMSDCVNVVSCHDVHYERRKEGVGWDIFIKMEFLTPLMKSLSNDISEETVVKLAKDMCTALCACQKLGIIHRDIKPQNIFISDSGDYKLGDFGIAKTVEKTTYGTYAGTEKYMAPEVYANKPYGAAADIYSLGLVLYWMLNSRRLPFLPTDTQKTTFGMEEDARKRRLSGEKIPAPINGSDALKSIVLKACAFNPADRYASAEEMLAALNNIGSQKKETNNAFNPDGRRFASAEEIFSASEDNFGDRSMTIKGIVAKADKGDTEAMLEVVCRYCIEMHKKSSGINLTNDLNFKKELNKKLSKVINQIKNGSITFLRTEIETSKYGKQIVVVDLTWQNARDYMVLAGSIDDSAIKTIISDETNNATITFEKKDFKQAVRHCLSVLSYDSKNVDVWNMLGKCYREMNRCDMAIECYEKAIDLKPEDGKAYANIAVAYMTINQLAEARENIYKALELTHIKDANYAIMSANAARIEAKSGNKDEANKLYKRAKITGYASHEDLKKFIDSCEQKNEYRNAPSGEEKKKTSDGKKKIHFDISLICTLILLIVCVFMIFIIPPFGVIGTIGMSVAVVKMIKNRSY